jgi:hypothetical protein
MANKKLLVRLFYFQFSIHWKKNFTEKPEIYDNMLSYLLIAI